MENLIEIGGKKFSEDTVWKALKSYTEDKRYCIGDWFKVPGDVDYYVLTGFLIDDKDYICLIGENGNRYSEPVEIDDFSRITKKDFDLVSSYEPYVKVKIKKIEEIE